MTNVAMTVREMAACLSVNEKTVYRMTQRAGLLDFKVAGSWRFKREDIDAWIEAQKTAARTREEP